jgi:Zn-dependent M28 family amino/carboxypeptidase
MVCGKWGVCAQINNVVSRIAGREPGRAVLLSAHYDSVPAAPGAADDGSGVAAILEIARILKRAPRAVRVVLLFGDGEELGLLGSELFVQNSRFFRRSGRGGESRGARKLGAEPDVRKPAPATRV